MSAKILVVDDHEQVVAWLIEELTREGYAAIGCTDPRDALTHAADPTCDLVVTDVEMPGLRGLDLMGAIHQHRPGMPVLFITAFGSVDLAVRAVKAGASDFVTKPFTVEVLLLAIERALRETEVRREVSRLRRVAIEDTQHGLVSRSPAMKRTLDRAERSARVLSPVLLTGETGVGKSTIARIIHAVSPRKDGPFIELNCAGVPTPLLEGELFGVRRGAYTGADRDREGLFARAHGGTLFLDEVGELPMEAQPKLLGVLETGRVRPLGGAPERTVDVRVISATNRDLQAAVRDRDFRADLLFRLDVVRIDVPPLRDRPEDIDGLVDQFVERAAARAGRPVFGVEAAGRDWLRRQPWPGNVRQLANLIEQAVALGDGELVRTSDLTNRDLADADAGHGEPDLDAAIATRTPLEDVELEYIRRTVSACDGNMSEAARRLGIDRRTLYRKLQR